MKAGERGDPASCSPDSGVDPPIGFLSLRLEPTSVGVAMTLSWSLDIEERGHDRHLRSLDPDVAVAHVRAFVDEYLATLEHR